MNSQNDPKIFLLTHAIPTVLECGCETRNPLQIPNLVPPDYKFIYLKSGCAQLRIESQIYEWLPGGIALLPFEAFQSRIELNITQPSEFMWWSFRYQINNVFDILRLFHFPALFFLREPQAFEHIFLQHLKLFHSEPNEKPSAVVLQQAKALEVIACLIDSLQWSDASVGNSSDIPPAFYKILQQIIHAPENGVHLKTLAQQYHMHPTYISNRFKYHFGITPAQLCRQLVVEKARSLLLSENYTVTEISNRLGFRDVSSFTQIFTEAEGVTPSKYRKTRWLRGQENSLQKDEER